MPFRLSAMHARDEIFRRGRTALLCIAILVLGLMPSTGDAASGPEIDVGVEHTS